MFQIKAWNQNIITRLPRAVLQNWFWKCLLRSFVLWFILITFYCSQFFIWKYKVRTEDWIYIGKEKNGTKFTCTVQNSVTNVTQLVPRNILSQMLTIADGGGRGGPGYHFSEALLNGLFIFPLFISLFPSQDAVFQLLPLLIVFTTALPVRDRIVWNRMMEFFAFP